MGLEVGWLQSARQRRPTSQPKLFENERRHWSAGNLGSAVIADIHFAEPIYEESGLLLTKNV
jgi:hypothetical protein